MSSADLDIFSGDYNDLTNKPTLFSGDYNDLTNKPTIPVIEFNPVAAAVDEVDKASLNGVIYDIKDSAARSDAGLAIENAAAVYDPEGEYLVGDYCTHDGIMYQCNTAIVSPGETWDPDHWDVTDCGIELTEINTNLTKSTPTFTWESNVSTQYPPSYDAFMFNGAVWCAIRVVITIAGSSWVKIGKINKKPSLTLILPAINSSDPTRSCMVQIDTNGDIYIYSTVALTTNSVNAQFVYQPTN